MAGVMRLNYQYGLTLIGLTVISDDDDIPKLNVLEVNKNRKVTALEITKVFRHKSNSRLNVVRPSVHLSVMVFQ